MRGVLRLSTSALKATGLQATGGGTATMGCVVPAAFCIRCFYAWRAWAVLLLGFSFGASLPSARELPQTLPNVAVDNRC